MTACVCGHPMAKHLPSFSYGRVCPEVGCPCVDGRKASTCVRCREKPSTAVLLGVPHCEACRDRVQEWKEAR
jgi:hypothetical protein